jgi:hypothetical protein
MEKKIFEFTNESNPSIKVYNTFYAATYGQFPHVSLYSIDEDGNRLEWMVKPKYILKNGLIDSIVYDLGSELTGIIVLG